MKTVAFDAYNYSTDELFSKQSRIVEREMKLIDYEHALNTHRKAAYIIQAYNLPFKKEYQNACAEYLSLCQSIMIEADKSITSSKQLYLNLSAIKQATALYCIHRDWSLD